MKIPLIPRIAALVLATTSFYAYVGQMVPQNEVQPPEETLISPDLTTEEMVTVGREVMDTKGLCFTCHTIGRTGALRFPDLAGVDVRAQTRVEGLSDVEYFAQTLYEPDAFIVPGFNPGMPTINRPPIGLTDEEILCVIAYLQSLGGTPTVTLHTAHNYYTPPAAETAPAAPAEEPAQEIAPGAPPAEGATPAVPPAPEATPGDAPAPAVPPRGVLLRPDTALQDMMRDANTADTGKSRTEPATGVAPVVAHEAARPDGAVTR